MSDEPVEGSSGARCPGVLMDIVQAARNTLLVGGDKNGRKGQADHGSMLYRRGRDHEGPRGRETEDGRATIQDDERILLASSRSLERKMRGRDIKKRGQPRGKDKLMKAYFGLLPSVLLWMAVVLLPLFGVLLPIQLRLLSFLPLVLLPRATRKMKRAFDRVEMAERSYKRTQHYYSKKI